MPGSKGMRIGPISSGHWMVMHSGHSLSITTSHPIPPKTMAKMLRAAAREIGTDPEATEQAGTNADLWMEHLEATAPKPSKPSLRVLSSGD